METAVIMIMHCADHACQLGSPLRFAIFSVLFLMLPALVFFRVMGRRFDRKWGKYPRGEDR